MSLTIFFPPIEVIYYIYRAGVCIQPGSSDSKESACNVGGLDLIPGLGRSPGEGNGYPLQYSTWRVPWTEEPGRLQPMGLQRVG